MQSYLRSTMTLSRAHDRSLEFDRQRTNPKLLVPGFKSKDLMDCLQDFCEVQGLSLVWERAYIPALYSASIAMVSMSVALPGMVPMAKRFLSSFGGLSKGILT